MKIDLSDKILYISKFGTNFNSSPEISRRIISANLIFIILPLVYFIFILIDFKVYLQPFSQLRFDQFIVPIFILICFLSLWLNKIGFTKFSRFFFLIIWPILLHILPIALLNTPPDYFLAFPLGIIFHSLLIQLMFSYHKETVLFLICYFQNILMMFFMTDILLYFDTDLDINTQIVDYRYYFLDAFLYWLLFNLITFYALYVIEYYIKRMDISKKLIEEQKEELDVLNQNLEKIVFRRTQLLEEQYEKLRNYAFYNAHLLRGPFCRVKGLILLQELSREDPDVEGQNDIREKLALSVEELDLKIKEIQEIVEKDMKRNFIV